MVTVDEAILHMKLSRGSEYRSPDVSAEVEGQIAKFIQAASDHLASMDVDVSADPLPPALHQAMLMLVAHFYKYRGATSHDKVWFTPIGVDRLIAPYKKVSL